MVSVGTQSHSGRDQAEQNPSVENVRYDWQLDEALAIYNLPLLELIGRANSVHRRYHDAGHLQKSSLLSIKTGGCPEDCGYCSQSAHHDVELTREKLMNPTAVIALAAKAKKAGAERFCMGAAWRKVRDGKEFDAVLEMIRGVRALDMEACVTLGMVNEDQARRLAEAGLTAYNHNLDTGPAYYPQIVSTHSYQDRLETLAKIRDAGIALCTGGIIGLGESPRDRVEMLVVLAGMNPHPESVPVNMLVPIEGTPLADADPVDPLEIVRMIATARLMMPQSMVRLSAGRSTLSRETQILCLVAGANSIFYGNVLLTTPNADMAADDALLEALGVTAE
ncbi:MAG: biotin synthase BioB [Zymomonas mobilis]|uniref:Biotin synthase n=1 Tax=Zymomonas mobilis subsp. mobilis (strain ATCC 10988 / DSM 424 / LMG 404 / NCIMB 8938 / NRRL B-806 / ZM1) TaxID=555217 RepID=A0A0H3G177_ZYMMA|nr:biotin synthase BioB [Zymomonas mobilis]ACV75647.1 biotin synthase [Zymomonas mobilis subsp. mobilis NCIMB 11163]AEH62572.1 biotin synthase [Zymomonas mobilis subsp. mobilis ATCC 10988]ART93564.1 biotin synthase BioB [Zymomonas mobilis subsp. mobilis]TQL27826.1 biotin synthase [Zymomonas mobilis]TQL29764.1 biotin synthase [Zymomonas mobilis]